MNWRNFVDQKKFKKSFEKVKFNAHGELARNTTQHRYDVGDSAPCDKQQYRFFLVIRFCFPVKSETFYINILFQVKKLLSNFWYFEKLLSNRNVTCHNSFNFKIQYQFRQVYTFCLI